MKKEGMELSEQKMKQEHLYEKLQQLEINGKYPFHMPGHKRNTELLPKWNPYAMDLTEIDGFDNLHDAQEILADTMQEIADFRQAEESFLLVNGSSGGLLAGISACVSHGDEMILARNCHKAVYHAILVNELTPSYIYPQFSHNLGINGGIYRKKVKKMLISHPNAKVLVLTSPTYEGVVSDIEGIVEEAHLHGIPVLVDQAHGAHFGMGEQFPRSAVTYGADIVVESVHKTLPAFTQTALLHVQGNLVDREKLRFYLSVFQTSSPSYVLMAGIDWCMEFCKKEKTQFLLYEERLGRLRAEISRLDHIVLFDGELTSKEFAAKDYDTGKLVFGVKDRIFSGQWLYEHLREDYGLEMEMASLNYVIAMTSVMDREEGFQKLLHALEEINELAKQKADETEEKNCVNNSDKRVIGHAERIREREGVLTLHMGNGNWENSDQDGACVQSLSPYEAWSRPGKMVLFSDSEGEIAKSMISLYPPGIPLIVPGEQISGVLIAYVLECEKQGLQVKGLTEKKIQVVDGNGL